MRRYRRKGRRAVPVRRGDWPRCNETLGARSRMAAGGRRRTVPDADRVPQGRGGDASLVGLPCGAPVFRDSKAGPRTVWLSRAARDILENVPRTSAWVFPVRGASQPPSRHWLDIFWRRIRAEADLPDVRLHDVRHSYASFALRQGVSVFAIARLLGQPCASRQSVIRHPRILWTGKR